MITEHGTREDFKRCIVEDVWVWEFACGHKEIADGTADEYKRIERRGYLCPECALKLSLPEIRRVLEANRDH